MKKLHLVFTFILLMGICLFSSLQAQEVNIGKVMNFQLRNSGPIYSGNQIDGYYFFYQVDKVDRKTRAYLLKIYDDNLKEVASKLINAPKYYSLLEGSFNGVTLMLEFYDYKAKQIVLHQYDRDAELINETKAAVNPKYSPVFMQQEGSEIRADFLHPIKYQGFINMRTVKNSKIGYEIQFISIDRTNKGWTYKSPTNSKLLEVASYMDGNSDLAAFIVMKKPSLLSSKLSTFLQAIDVGTGKELFTAPMIDKSYSLFPLKGNVDPETGNIMVLGQYFKLGDNPMKDKSLGLFSYIFDTKGNIVNKSYVGWVKDVSKFVPIDKKGKIEDVGFIYFHYMTRLENGKIYAIGEQYRKAVSGAGVAMKMLGGSASAFKIVTEDMMIFQFSEDFNLESIEIFDKSKSNIELPEGYGNIGVVKLGHVLKAYDAFDYSFTQMADDEQGFIIGYVDYEKIKGEKNRTVFGAIVLNDEEYSVDKIPFNNKGNRLVVLPAKPGYVMIYEYTRKTKTISVRLEQINY